MRLPLQSGTQGATSQTPAVLHEGWIRLLNSGSDPSHGAYQVFELLEGRTLAEAVQSGPLNSGDWVNFVVQSLDAVGALHGAGWIHGDLNAGNFVETAAGWKLLELPFCRFGATAGRSALFGSIHTLAPEQIDGAKADVRSDIYALGCLYYYAASGAYPHPGASSQEIAIHCLRFAAEPLRDQAPHLHAAWCDAVMKLIATQPGGRVDSIAAARHLLGVAVA